jgi:hypothetical protein
MSYEGRGINKLGIHAVDYAMIYTSHEPKHLEGEAGMTKAPIRVIPSSPQHKLDPASCLNYAKVYTVDYDVKVWFIGRIHPDSEWSLTEAFNEVHPPMQARDRATGLESATAPVYTPGGSSSNQAQYATKYTQAPFPSSTA